MSELGPEVSLLQEVAFAALEPLRDLGTVVAVPSTPRADWGSAVFVANSTPARPFAVTSHGSYLAGADVDYGAERLTVISTHVCPAREQATYLQTFVETVKPLLGDRSLVVAGDFNAARRFDEVYGRRVYTKFFAAMDEAGFHDVHWALHGREVQSFWGGRTKEAYQDDHIFVAKRMAARVRACDVVDNVRVRGLSDHGPVRLELSTEVGRDECADDPPK